MRRPDLKVPVFAKERFRYNPETFSFETEASGFSSDDSFLAPLYSDSDEVGFSIMSPLTRKTVYFVLDKEVKDDGGTLRWEFVSLVDNTSTIAGLRVTIHNT